MKTQIEQIASFIAKTQYEDLPVSAIEKLKLHLLDSLGSFFHATGRPTIKKLIRQLKTLGTGDCPVPILGKLPIDRAAQFYTALIRYPDFMDNFLGKEATCHPSDNIGSLLAIARCGNASNKDFILSMAIGYAIECRLVEEIPVMIKGFDHTVLLAYSLTGAISKMLHLNEQQIAHALAIAGCSINPLVTSRAAYTYEWKGLASSFVAQACVNAALLAKEGITGPLSLFEGPKGFNEIYGMKLTYDWSKEDFSLIQKCSLKTYNAEVHTQVSLTAIQELQQTHAIIPEQIKEIEIKTFLTAYHIVGGGAYGDRKEVHTKEQADHSLPYVAAVLILDGKVYPEQLLPERISQDDVQTLLKKVRVHTGSPLHKPLVVAGLLDPPTQKYPDKLISRVTIHFNDGTIISQEKEDYPGYYTNPFDLQQTASKFRQLTSGTLTESFQTSIIEACQEIENINLFDLLTLIANFQQEGQQLVLHM